MARQGRGREGFTLIEMIGVLAILAILAAMILPSVIQQINAAVEEGEEGSLGAMVQGLEAAVLANRVVPADGNADLMDATGAAGANGVADWVEFISSQVDLPSALITNEQERGCARRYWLDPSASVLGAAVDTNGNGAYEQDRDTLPTAVPTNVRGMIISDLSGGCANNIAGSVGAANFDATWNQTGGLVESPTLKIQRLNFTQLFERVSLISISASLFGRESFSNITAPVAASPVVALPVGALVSSVFINGSFAGLNGSTGTTMQVGYAAAPAAFFGPLAVDGGANLPASWTVALPGAEPTMTSVDVQITAVASVPTPDTVSGYADVTVEFHADPQYQFAGQAAATVIDTSAVPTVTVYVINGSELQLFDQNAVQLVSKIVKEAESFSFSPGPPSIWGH